MTIFVDLHSAMQFSRRSYPRQIPDRIKAVVDLYGVPWKSACPCCKEQQGSAYTNSQAQPGALSPQDILTQSEDGEDVHHGARTASRSRQAGLATRNREKDIHHTKGIPSSGIFSDRGGMASRREVRSCIGPRTDVVKSRLLKYTIRWHEISALHRIMETGQNKRPASETLNGIAQAMRDTACENPSPGYLSRAQFISTISRTLKSCNVAGLHRLYSSFDPHRTDRVRHSDVLACLLVTHKPETQAFLECLQQTFIGNMGAINRDTHAELTKGNRQVAWRFLRQMFELYQAAGTKHVVSMNDVEHIFLACTLSDHDVLQMKSTFAACQRGPSVCPSTKKDSLTSNEFDSRFCDAWSVLDLFNAHMTDCQAIVKSGFTGKQYDWV